MPTVPASHIEVFQPQNSANEFGTVDKIIAWLERNRATFENLDKYQVQISASGRSVKFQTTQYGEVG